MGCLMTRKPVLLRSLLSPSLRHINYTINWELNLEGKKMFSVKPAKNLSHLLVRFLWLFSYANKISFTSNGREMTLQFHRCLLGMSSWQVIEYEILPKSLESEVLKQLKQLNYIPVVRREDARLKVLLIVQVHCVAPAWLALEGKRFIIALHKLDNKFAVIYWLNIWTWLQQRNRLESCMADFGLEP